MRLAVLGVGHVAALAGGELVRVRRVGVPRNVLLALVLVAGLGLTSEQRSGGGVVVDVEEAQVPAVNPVLQGRTRGTALVTDQTHVAAPKQGETWIGPLCVVHRERHWL